jgi:hypothetical protein
MNNTIRKLAFPVAVLMLSAAMPAATQAGGKVTIPFSPGNFTTPTVINNPLLPLTTGENIFTFVSTVDDECEVNTSQVLNAQVVTAQGGAALNPKTVDGGLSVVTVYDVVWTTDCNLVHVTPMFNQLEEVTFDWYAQDNAGNVWYVGEWTYDCDVTGCELGEGSWETGVDGATPGIVMLAEPSNGDQYDQEFYEGMAEDKAKVLRTKAWVTLYREDAADPRDFHGCLTTKEWSPLELGAIEQKSYCPANGNAPFLGGQVNTKVLHGKTVVEERIEDDVLAPLPANGTLPAFAP